MTTPAVKESMHYSALQDWLWDGSLSRLSVCQSLLKRGIQPVCGWSNTAAALSLVSRHWPEDGLILTHDLFDDYVAAGMLSVGQPIQDYSIGTALEYNGLQFLHAALKARNVEATIAGIRHGALEVTDFSRIDMGEASVCWTPEDALMAAVNDTWPEEPGVHAQFRALLMKRQVERSLAGQCTHQVGAGRRMKNV